MNLAEVLVATRAYLQQVAEAITPENDGVEVPDLLLQELNSASELVVQELEGKQAQTHGKVDLQDLF
jgi:hypothetical protein